MTLRGACAITEDLSGPQLETRSSSVCVYSPRGVGQLQQETVRTEGRKTRRSLTVRICVLRAEYAASKTLTTANDLVIGNDPHIVPLHPPATPSHTSPATPSHMDPATLSHSQTPFFSEASFARVYIRRQNLKFRPRPNCIKTYIIIMKMVCGSILPFPWSGSD